MFDELKGKKDRGIVHEDMDVPWWVFPGIPAVLILILYGWYKILCFLWARIENAESPEKAILWLIISVYVCFGVPAILRVIELKLRK